MTVNYSPEMCDKVIEVLSGGGLLGNVAEALGVDIDIITHWRGCYPIFGAAIEAGLIFSEEWWEEDRNRNQHNPAYDIEHWRRVMREHFGQSEQL